MHNIRDFMAGDHRRCDEIFADVEQAVAAGAWSQASTAFEEALLFPAFEEKTGMYMGPTQVMRGEHVQMRELLDAARDAVAAKDADEYSGNAETLLIMMQQHNMKEENVLYPMCDQHLIDQVDALLPQLQERIQVKTD
jgi:DUF438 domain-containing protein